MIKPPQKALAKAALATMCVSMSCSALSAESPDKTGCEIINHTNYQEFMVKRDNLKVSNPFKPEACVLVDFDKKTKNDLSVDDFDGNEKLYDYFNAFQDRSRTRVEMVMDYDSDQLYTMFQFNTDERSIRAFKKLAKGKDISMFMDEFLFLHEMAHFDPKVTSNKGYSVSKKEMTSDVVALVMLKSTHDLSMDEFFKLTESLFEVRQEEQRVANLIKRRNGRHRDRGGDHSHYDEDIVENIGSFLNYVRDNNIELRVNSINEAREVAMHMMHNYQGSEMIDLESKTMSIKNSPYHKEFLDMPSGEQMVYYERNKALLGGELLAMFEDYHTMLPSEVAKLDQIAPEIIADASNHFDPEHKRVAQSYLSSLDSVGEVEITASLNLDESIAIEPKNNAVSMDKEKPPAKMYATGMKR